MTGPNEYQDCSFLGTPDFKLLLVFKSFYLSNRSHRPTYRICHWEALLFEINAAQSKAKRDCSILIVFGQ